MPEKLSVELICNVPLSAAKPSGEVMKVAHTGVAANMNLVVLTENSLIGYEYLCDEGKIEFRWRQDVTASKNIEDNVMWLKDVNNDGVDEVIFLEKDGLKAFRVQNNNLTLLAKSELFHENYGNTQVAIGKFFTNQKLIGVLRKDRNNISSFYTIDSDCLGKPNCGLIRKLSANIQLSPAWKAPGTKVSLVRINLEREKEIFVLRTNQGLEFFEFNERYRIVPSSRGSMTKALGPQSDGERIIFGAFTGGKHQDFVHLNSTGMFLYKFAPARSDFTFLASDLTFSASKGWSQEILKTIFVGDFDEDKKSDLIFTGPEGVGVKTFDPDLKIWQDLMTPDGNYGKILATGETSVVIIQSSDGSLNFASITTETVENEISREKGEIFRVSKDFSDTNAISVFEIDQIPKSSVTSDFRWSEQWTSIFEEKVLSENPSSDGFVRFTMPLMDLSLTQYLKVQLALSYSDENQREGVLGVGWNIPLLNNHIKVDYQCSMFDDDSIFTFYGMGERSELKRDVSLETEGSGVLRFTLDSQKDLSFSYHTGTDGYWIIDTPTEIFVYGENRGRGATQFNLSWENSRCGKTDIKNLKRIPVAWFIRERHDKKAEKSIFYQYNIEENSITPGSQVKYTNSLTLKSIILDGQPIVTFSYKKKPNNEESQFEVLKNGKVSFPIPLSDENFLTKISMKNSNQLQTFSFTYKNSWDTLVLSTIQQNFKNFSFENLLAMDYEKMSNGEILMKNIKLPRGTEASFTRKKLTRDIAPGVLVKKFPVGEKPSITPGVDYKVIAFAREKKINLRVYNGIDKDELLEIPVDTREFEYQVVRATKFMFLIVIAKNEGKEIVIVKKRDDGGWVCDDERHEFGKNASVYFGEKFVGFLESGGSVIEIIQWSHDEGAEMEIFTENLENPKKTAFIQVISNGPRLFAYDDIALTVFHLDSQEKWARKIIKEIPGFQSSTHAVINKFNIDEKITKLLIESLSKNLIQIDNNHLILTKLHENQGTLSVVAHMMLINLNFGVAKEKTEVLPRENIFNLVHYENQFDTKFSMKYSTISGKFSIQLHDIISGNLYNDLQKIPSDSERKKQKSEVIKTFNDSPNWKNHFKNIFPLDWKKYHAKLTPSGLICDDFTIIMTGDGWSKEKTSEETKPLVFKVGKYLEIRQTGNSTNEIEIHNLNNKKNTLIHQAKIGGEFVNSFPLFIAYQTPEQEVKIINFSPENDLGSTKTIKNSKLLFGNTEALTVVVNSTSFAHSEPHEIQILPLADLVTERSEFFVNKMTQTSNNLKRVTEFDRGYKIDEGGNLSEKFSIMPGGNIKEFGWQEEAKFMNFTSKVVTREKKIFNFDGGVKSHVVIEGEAKNFKKKKEKKENFTQKIMDKSKNLVISDIRPLKVGDESFVYFGFEDYEEGAIGDPKKEISWNYNKDHVMKENFSFTGRNFLRLSESGDSLKGVVTPKDDGKLFVASCWIRSNKNLQLNKDTEIFTAKVMKISGQTIAFTKAQVKQQIDEWNYLEILIDFGKLRKQNIPSNSSKKLTKFQISLKIHNKSSSTTLDVDHIKFQPIDHKSWIDVYDKNDHKTEKILPNGAVQRMLHDKFKNQIASIDEKGNIAFLRCSTQTGKLITPPTTQKYPSQVIFTPSEDTFYNPTEFWKKWKISGFKTKKTWSFSPSQIHHTSSSRHEIEIDKVFINLSSNVIRFGYSLTPAKSSLKFIAGEKAFLELSTNLELLVEDESFPISPEGELTVAFEESRVMIWIDGVLTADFVSSFDLKSDESLKIEFFGPASLESFIHFNNPSIKTEYFNGWGEPKQIIQIAGKNEVLVTETLYDPLGRTAITTKPTKITRSADEPLAMFYENFVSNENYDDSGSVWETHEITGEVSTLNPEHEGFPYKRTEFEKNPSNSKKTQGLPGKENSITGPYSKKIESSTDIPFLLNLFPPLKGFTMHTTVKENGSKEIKIFDMKERKVAVYVKVPGFDHILSVNEYDSDGRIVKVLPPRYHEEVRTASKMEPWVFGDEHLSENERKLQKIYGTMFSYDADGNLVRKSTPDIGAVEFVYDKNVNRRFTKLSDGKVSYFVYDDAEQLIETGILEENLEIDELRNLADSDDLPERKPSQEFTFSNHDSDPMRRRAEKAFVTHNEDEKLSEEVTFDINNKIISRTSKLSNEPVLKIEKTYEMKKMLSMVYPKDSSEDNEGLKIIHKYNKLGQLISIGTPDDPTEFAEFFYTADGLVEEEKIQPNSKHEYTRKYDFQKAGYLSKIADPFLEEHLSYTSNGYGQQGFGDGVLSSATTKAKWPANANPELFKAKLSDLQGDKKLLSRCLKVLQQSGHISQIGVVKKSLNFKLENLPVECKGKIGYQLSKKLGEKQMPEVYGHKFAYGPHRELMRAKYFTDGETMKQEPLMFHSFSKDSKNFSIGESKEIFKKLAEGGFLVVDQKGVDPGEAIGLQGKETLLREGEIEETLKSQASPYFQPMQALPEIVNLITEMIYKKKFANEKTFESDFLAIYGFTGTSTDWQVENLKIVAGKIFEDLSEKNLLPTFAKPFDPINPKLLTILRKYLRKMSEIFRIIDLHFKTDVGESPFDYSSYNIDSNGNHRLFYNGYQRTEITYKEKTNKVEKVKVDDITSSQSKTYDIDHDENGNVIKALHRGIERIEYDPTTQRTKKVAMTDGRVIQFFYDAIGERIMKQVFTSQGNLATSTRYIRDEKGNVLYEKKTIFPSMQKIITKYIYGPRGLIGFVRNGEFLSVTTDHAGSIRLIIKNGKVVVSYDYLPYGELMRKFVSSPEYEISYRYTGQEFDEETGLYNYHARLYDFSIGRFYQIDPQAQYFSPYLYAGNSPISFVDPDGQFVFLIAVGLAVGGAYLGGAAKNNNWNPIKWNWKDKGTYLSMGFGAFAGATLPYTAVSLGVTGSLIAGGVGTVTGYVGASAANQNFNPAKWDWKSPTTYQGFFNGFCIGFDAVSGIKSAHTLSKEIVNPLAKQLFMPAVITGAAGLAYYKGVQAQGGKALFWEWEWDNEHMSVTLGAMVQGAGIAITISSVGVGMKDLNVKEFLRSPEKELLRIMSEAKRQKFEKLLNSLPENAAEMVGGILVGLCFVGEVSDLIDFDPQNVHLDELSTYQSFYEGYLQGKQEVSEKRLLWEAQIAAEKAEKEEKTDEVESDEEIRSRNKRSVLILSLVTRSVTHRAPRLEFSDKNSEGIMIPRNHEPIIPQLTFTETKNSSTFNILEMGDRWLQQSDTLSNLTLIHFVMEKFLTKSKESRKNQNITRTKSDSEYRLMTSVTVNDFVEKLVENAEKVGVDMFTVDRILEKHISLTKLVKKVEKEIRDGNHDKVGGILKQELLRVVVDRLRKKFDDLEALNELMEEELENLDEKLFKFESEHVM